MMKILSGVKKSGIFQVIDGYGIAPFVKKEIKFIPLIILQALSTLQLAFNLHKYI